MKDTMTTTSPSEVRLTPVNDNILVRPHEREKVSRGGVVIPETAEKPQQYATILAVGPDCPLDVLEGQTVIHGQFAGSEIQYRGADGKDEKLLILSPTHILAIVHD